MRSDYYEKFKSYKRSFPGDRDLTEELDEVEPSKVSESFTPNFSLYTGQIKDPTLPIYANFDRYETTQLASLTTP